MKCNQSRIGFELVSPCPFPTTITTAPRAPPFTYSYLIISIIILLIRDFFLSALADGFPQESNWQQISSSLQYSGDLNNVVIWMISTCSLISPIPSTCTSHLVTVPSAPITNYITATFMFHCFFSSLARSGYLCLFSFFFSFTLWSAGTATSTNRCVLFFCWLSLGLVVCRDQVTVCISKSQRILKVSFSRTDSWLCIYHSFEWSNLNLVHLETLIFRLELLSSITHTTHKHTHTHIYIYIYIYISWYKWFG